jgi:hypothetical protein
MMAIRTGIGSPPKLGANTSLGIGHNRSIILTFIAKQEAGKMKVSLSRNIHIMASSPGYLEGLFVGQVRHHALEPHSHGLGPAAALLLLHSFF